MKVKNRVSIAIHEIHISQWRKSESDRCYVYVAKNRIETYKNHWNFSEILLSSTDVKREVLQIIEKLNLNSNRKLHNTPPVLMMPYLGQQIYVTVFTEFTNVP